MPIWSATVNVMVSAARKAARGLVRDFGEVENLQVSRKGPGDFVTAADLRVERTLQEELERARPAYGFLMEEAGVVEGTDKTHRWIIDPIDGTTNFMHGFPEFAISIALEREGALIAGLIYNPIRDEIFWAEHGKGAYLNDRRLRVSSRDNLSDALLVTGIPHEGRPDQDGFLKELSLIMRQVAGVRRTGSAALDLAYVAAGRFDGMWERNLNIWDIAAGVLLVREARGTVSDIDGGRRSLETGSLIAANESLQAQLAKAIKKANA